MKDFFGCLVSLFIIVALCVILTVLSFNLLSEVSDFNKHTTLQHVECYSGSYKIFDSDIYVWPNAFGATHYNLDKQHITLNGNCIFTPVENK